MVIDIKLLIRVRGGGLAGRSRLPRWRSRSHRARAARPLTFNVSSQPARESDSRRPAPAIALGFAGVSIDYCNITSYAGAGPNPILDHLLLALSPRAE